METEFNEFLNEIDSLDIDDKKSAIFPQAPQTNWIVQMDPHSGLPFYQEIASGIKTWDMPEEYKIYLERYQEYLQGYPAKSPTCHLHKKTHKGFVKRQKPLTGRSTSPVGDAQQLTSHLTEYIAYSASSGSDDDNGLTKTCTYSSTGSSGSSSPVPTPVVKEQNSSTAQVQLGSPSLSRPSIPDTFVGPRLPRSNLASTFCPSPDVCLVDCRESIPVPNIDDNVELGSSLKQPNIRSLDGDMEPSSRRNKTLLAMAQSLLDRFAFFDTNLADVATLHILYIQLTTRVEDWCAGHLSTRYFKEKVKETEACLQELISYHLPCGWSAYWDGDYKRYFYQNLATGVSQWDMPDENSVSSTSKSRSLDKHQPVPDMPDGTAADWSVESKRCSSADDNAMPTDCDNCTPNQISQVTCESSVTFPSPSKCDTTELANSNHRVLEEQLEEFLQACEELREDDDKKETCETASVSPLLSEDLELKSSVEDVLDVVHLADPSVAVGCTEDFTEQDTRRPKIVLSSRVLASKKSLPEMMAKWQHLQQTL